MLAEYHDVDRRLRVLEECLDAAVEDYDRAGELEMDMRRGK